MFAEQSKLAGMVTKGSSASLQVHSAREQLETLEKTAEPSIKEAIEKVDKELGELLSGRRNPGGGEAEPGWMMRRPRRRGSISRLDRQMRRRPRSR